MTSIITAAFSIKYLDCTWNSIKKQTYKNWEWVLVIDSSKDVKKWYNDKRKNGEFDNYNVWCIYVEKNQGRFGLVSRNIGAMVCSYNKILFLDDDNEFQEEDYIDELLRIYVKTKKIPYTELHIVGKKPGSTVDRNKITSLARHHIDLGNPLYFKNDFLKCGYFDDSRNKIMFDWDLIEKIVELKGSDNFIKVNRHLLFRHKRY